MLETIRTPEDVKKIPKEQLDAFAEEIRALNRKKKRTQEKPKE